MKKKLLIFFLLLISLNCYAQKVETICEIPFNEEFKYFMVDPEDDSGSIPGISNLHAFNDKLFFINSVYGSWYCVDKNGSFKRIWDDYKEGFSVVSLGVPFFVSSNNYYVYGYFLSDRNETIIRKVTGDDVKSITVEMDIPGSQKSRPLYEQFYLTGNNLFYEDYNYSENIISFNLDENGSICRSVNGTKDFLTSDDGMNLGWRVVKNNKDKVIGNFFGDHAVDSYKNGLMYYLYKNETMDMSKSAYKDRKNLDSTLYKVLGYDNKGLTYFYEAFGDAATGTSYFDICVFDTWTKTPYFYENYDNGQWNPPLNENGNSIPKLSFAVSNVGEVYYSDCDLNAKKYLIKQVENRWYSDIGIDTRHIGRFNTNQIPLYKSDSTSSETNGYNFENDIVWEKETEGEWSRIQKLDGREGWVESKYITFDDGKSDVPVVNSKTVTVPKPSDTLSYNVAKNKIMQTNDNLRLRKEEATSSEVITTMLKGTKVKILKLGKEETIDGIKSCWVKVEVQEGAKDRNGNAIQKGTTGWCYGGYLE